MTAKLLATLAMAGISLTATAQEEGGPPRWSVGALGIAYATPFEAEKTDYLPVPYLSYRGDRFFIDGTGMGYHLLKPAENSDLSLGVDIIAGARMLPGQSRSKVTADLGLRATIAGSFGALELTGLHDVTDTSNGMELMANYGYDITFDKLTITPSVGVTWQNRKMANYMWGVTQAQQDKMIEKDKPVLPVYQPDDSILNYNAGITAVYSMSNSWTLIGFAQGAYLDKSIRNNPGIDKDYEMSVGLGVAYNF